MNSSSTNHEVTNITVESLINKLKKNFKDKEMDDLTKIFGSALHGIRVYKRRKDYLKIKNPINSKMEWIYCLLLI
jgi:hypothetical protein